MRSGMRALAVAGLLAVAGVALEGAAPRPALACLAGGAGDAIGWDSRDFTAAFVGTIVPGQKRGAHWLVRVDALYSGDLVSPVSLYQSGLCNFPSEKFVTGQRLLVVAYGNVNDNQVRTAGNLIWFLDAHDRVTGLLYGLFCADCRVPHRPSLDGTLRALGLPDAAMPPPRGWSELGLLLLALAGLLASLRLTQRQEQSWVS